MRNIIWNDNNKDHEQIRQYIKVRNSVQDDMIWMLSGGNGDERAQGGGGRGRENLEVIGKEEKY